jgi:hypothetical protein
MAVFPDHDSLVPLFFYLGFSTLAGLYEIQAGKSRQRWDISKIRNKEIASVVPAELIWSMKWSLKPTLEEKWHPKGSAVKNG